MRNNDCTSRMVIYILHWRTGFDLGIGVSNRPRVALVVPDTAGLKLLPIFIHTSYGTLSHALWCFVSLNYTMYEISHLLL